MYIFMVNQYIVSMDLYNQSNYFHWYRFHLDKSYSIYFYKNNSLFRTTNNLKQYFCIFHNLNCIFHIYNLLKQKCLKGKYLHNFPHIIISMIHLNSMISIQLLKNMFYMVLCIIHNNHYHSLDTYLLCNYLHNYFLIIHNQFHSLNNY